MGASFVLSIEITDASYRLSTKIQLGEAKDVFLHILQVGKLRIRDIQCNLLKMTDLVSDAR